LNNLREFHIFSFAGEGEGWWGAKDKSFKGGMEILKEGEE